jgi:hypothetical protein
MTKTNKELKSELFKLKIQKSKWWCPERHRNLEIMACEREILIFISKWTQRMDDVKPITAYNLFDFWKYIQDIKDDLNINTSNYDG